MSAIVVDPSAVAQSHRDRIRAEVAALPEPLRIVGFLAQDEGPAATYARYAAKGCASVGIDFDLRVTTPTDVEAAIGEANRDPEVHGIFLYYPIGGPVSDRWLRELVDPRKDVEGMHAFWSHCLYENRRYLDEARTMRTILPCTPLAILKLLEEAGMRSTGVAAPLEGVTACVINRSDIVGRPLSAMLANDGAEVVSLDLGGAQVFEPAIGRHAHSVRDSDLGREAALARADVVITGVPSPDFDLVRPDEIKPGAICVNFSQYRNFDPGIVEVASAFVPRVGPMTVTMAMRNAVRLYRGVQGAWGSR